MISFSRLSRTLALAGALLAPLAPGAAAQEIAQTIADHFSSVKTMTGEFVQFGPRGEQTGGKFYIARPGRIRFDYDGKSGFKVISDGKSVAINNPRLKTWDLYGLDQTPLRLLLGDRIDLSKAKVSEVREEADQVTIVLNDSSVLGKSKIAMLFDPKSYELKQWTITDAQGKQTTIMVTGVKQGGAIDSKLFKIDYETIRTKQKGKTQR